MTTDQKVRGSSPFERASCAGVSFVLESYGSDPSPVRSGVTRAAVAGLILFVFTGCSTGSELSLPTDSASTIPESTTTSESVPAVPETWQSVYLRIWDDFRAAQNRGDYPLDVALSPTVNVEKAEESIAAYKEAMKLWLATLDLSLIHI